MKIDYSSFEQALGQLQKSLSFLNSEMSRENPDLREQFRAAVIQAFEYTYELGVKMMRRQLEQISASTTEIHGLSFMDLIRYGAEAGLVQDVPAYSIYRDKRSLTSHTYDQDRAEEVIEIVDDFVVEMQFLLDALKKRNS